MAKFVPISQYTASGKKESGNDLASKKKKRKSRSGHTALVTFL
jgi:hypothetical protein